MNILIGMSVGILGALIFPFLLRKLKINEEDAKKINPILTVIAVVVSINIYANYIAEGTKEDKANLSAAVKNYEQLADGNAGGVENKNTGDANANNATRSAYILNESAKVSKPYLERMGVLTQEMDAFVSDNMLSSKLYTDRNVLNATKNLIIKYPQLLDENLVEYDEMIVAQRNLLNSLSFDKKFLNDTKGGFEKSVTLLRQLQVNRAIATKRFLDKVNVIVKLADKNFGNVKITDGSVDFQNEADNALYNKNYTELQQAANEETQAIKALDDARTNALNNLKSLGT